MTNWAETRAISHGIWVQPNVSLFLGRLSPRTPPAVVLAPHADRDPAQPLYSITAAAAAHLATIRPARVHAILRDPDVPADLAPWHLGDSRPADDGDLVAALIVAPGEPAWLGVYTHDHGLPAAVMPPESPSRAFAKIEEAIAWRDLPFAAGQVALEIGAAPGGAALALARRGLGLGLYIAQQIVLAHGATIDLTSDERATTFTITWPRDPKEERLTAAIG